MVVEPGSANSKKKRRGGAEDEEDLYTLSVR